MNFSMPETAAYRRSRGRGFNAMTLLLGKDGAPKWKELGVGVGSKIELESREFTRQLQQ